MKRGKMEHYDTLAVRFQESTDEREIDRLFKELRAYWLPWVHGKLNDFNKRDQEEFLAIYDEKILRSLVLWKRKSRWSTYSFSWAKKAYFDTKRLYPMRDKLYSSIDEYDEYED